MSATLYIGGDPDKVDVSGYVKGDILAANAAGDLVVVPIGANTEILAVDTVDPSAVDWVPAGGGGLAPSATVANETTFGIAPNAGILNDYSRGDHTHGTPATPPAFVAYTAGTGFVTSGNLSVGTAAFLALGPEVSVTAATGDVLELFIDSLLCDTAGGDLQVDAATRVAAADTNWWSTGTNVSRFPGGLGSWYVQAGRFDSPHAAARYTVQVGDISGGAVAVQLYGRASGSARTVFANATYPLRWWVVNLGPAS